MIIIIKTHFIFVAKSDHQTEMAMNEDHGLVHNKQLKVG